MLLNPAEPLTRQQCVELVSTLTRRELQVFRRIACGDRMPQIAAELALSVKTLSTYRQRLMQKLGVRSNAEIGIYAYRVYGDHIRPGPIVRH